MRKKLAIGVGLVVVALAAAACVMWWMSQGEPQLRAGMAKAEVDQVLGTPMGPRSEKQSRDYYQRGGWFHHELIFTVYFDEDDRVVRWEKDDWGPRRPPWLDRALNGVGW
jgi:outer membrane protein assembly factor BamE (lipoprotein component of BamABCDE complex)